MYTFEDKGGRSVTLRPEGTAGAARAMLENGLYNGGYPVKLYYNTSCYRYEKPQAGRLRELHQFGVEMFGTAEPIADAQDVYKRQPFSAVASVGLTGPHRGPRSVAERRPLCAGDLLSRVPEETSGLYGKKVGVGIGE